MLKLYCVTETRPRPGDPVINGHQTGEMVLYEAKEFSQSDVARLQTAITLISTVVENVYRINAVKESAQEYRETIAALNSDNVEAMLRTERRFRSYVLEFDMFLDYWQSSIAHYKRIDGTCDDKLTADYKALFRKVTTDAYDNHVEYRLLDLIRNQTAHVQSPVNRIHVGIEGNEVYTDRDILLEKCKSGENKKKILREQETELALSPIVDVTENCLIEIHDGLMDYQIDEQVITECEVIKSFIEYIVSKDLLFQPWLIMDKITAVPETYHIRDMKAYGYIIGRIVDRER